MTGQICPPGPTWLTTEGAKSLTNQPSLMCFQVCVTAWAFEQQETLNKKKRKFNPVKIRGGEYGTCHGKCDCIMDVKITLKHYLDIQLGRPW